MSSSLSPPASAAVRAALALAAIGFAGCRQPTGDGPPPTGGDEIASSGGRTSPGSAVESALVERADYDATINAQRGKVVLVDFWATWCGPCLAQLPHSIRLAAEHSQDLAVITVSMDGPGQADNVAKKLAELGAARTINLVSKPTGPHAMEAFEIDGGALPHYKLYDRQGKLRETFGVDPSAAKQFTSDDIAAAVEELVQEPADAASP